MTGPLSPATRVRVVGGPWPERIACHGVIPTVPEDYSDGYPVNGLGRNEVLVLLDVDPLAGGLSKLAGHEWWSCVYDRGDLVVQAPCPRGCEDGVLNPDPGDDWEDQLHPVTCVTCDGMGEVDTDG